MTKDLITSLGTLSSLNLSLLESICTKCLPCVHWEGVVVEIRLLTTILTFVTLSKQLCLCVP